MTAEERKELERVRKARGRYGENEDEAQPTYKDAKKYRLWRLKCFGREIELKITQTNK